MITVDLDPQALDVLITSVGYSLDVAARKIRAAEPGSKKHGFAQQDYQLLLDAQDALRDAQASALLDTMEGTP